MSRILIIPPMKWYMEIHAEYLIRYLSDKFFIEVADVPYPPYQGFLDRFPETQPFQRNPDDYDLIWPILPTHWVVTEKDKYAHKVATVFFQPGEGRYLDVATVGCSTPIACAGFGDFKHHHLKFGVDTDLFKPLGFAREDDLLHVGMVGTINNPRRMVKEVMLPLMKEKGIRVMLFCTNRLDQHSVDLMGGQTVLEHIVGGEKSWPGLANVYNQLDVLIRCDSDPGYAFPVLEAAACGVPVVATNQGIEHLITGRGGGILVEADEVDANGSGRIWYQSHPEEVAKRVRKAVLDLRDDPKMRKEMGAKAREEVVKNWNWDRFIPFWEEFFLEGLEKAKR